MKPMIWHPEPRDRKVNQYLDSTNREPPSAIIGISLRHDIYVHDPGITRYFLEVRGFTI